LQLVVDFCVSVNGVLTEDMALAMMDIYRQAVLFGFVSQSTEKYV
jgi:hypothetical protein